MVLNQNNMKTYFTPRGLINNIIGKNLNELFKASEKSNASLKDVACMVDIKKLTADKQTECVQINDSNYCAICGVRHESVEDKAPKGVTSDFWMNCDYKVKSKCNYWIHSYCGGFGYNKKDFQEDFKKLSFRCPTHAIKK